MKEISMRVLLLGRTDRFDGKSSVTNVALGLVGKMLQRRDDLHVTWTIPTGIPEDDLVAAKIPIGEASQRLEFVRCQATFGGRLLGYFLSEPMYHLLSQVKTDRPYDLIVCNQPGMIPAYRTLLRNKYQAGRYSVATPVVGWQLWLATETLLKEAPEYVGGEMDVLAESLGVLGAEVNVWESQIMLDGFLRGITKWVSPHAIREIKRKSVIVNSAIDVSDAEKVLQARRERIAEGGRPGLFWGGRIAGSKKPRLTFPLMRQVMARMGGDVEALVSTQTESGSDQGKWAKEEFGEFRIQFNQDRAEFLRNMQHGDVFLCNSVSETYGAAWLEMLAAGLLGVFERKTWVEGLLPDWYPFVTDSTDEQVEIAVALLRDWPDGPLWREYVPKVLEWLAAEHDVVGQADAFLEVLDRVFDAAMDEDRALGTGSVGALANEAAEALWNGEPLPEDEIYRRMNEFSDTSREWGKKGDLISRFYLRRCLQEAGWRDTCQSTRVEFVKENQ
jgi:hypothetical protein